MTFDQSVHEIAEYIRRRKSPRPLAVGVDGIDAAGKTTLADSLRDELRRPDLAILRASIDGFHNPRAVRYARGALSSEGYYFDSFNYDALKNFLLLPLRGERGREYRLKVFDVATDTPLESSPIPAPEDWILIFDGVFLFRPELADFWDVKIFVDIPFEESLRRARERDSHLFGGKMETDERYTRRYLPGQKLYLDLCHPKSLADIIIHNEEPTHPIVEILRNVDDRP